MDAGLKRGFAIGFAVVALLTAGFAWRSGRLSAPVPGGPPAVATLPKAPQTPAPTPPSAAPPKASEAPAAPASPAPPAPQAEAKPQPPEGKGAFDVVRVEPSGDIVVAGRCAAGCTVELTANGRVQDKAQADGAGNFAMTPPPLAPGDHQLGLKVTGPDGAVATSEQTVTVSVPKAPSREVVVVLNEPDAPSKVLQRPGQAPAAPAPSSGPSDVARREPPAAPGAAKTPGEKTPAQSVAALSLGAVDAERGRFFVQGTAPAGARLRVYLNNALIAEPVAGAEERWSVRVERGLAPGRYVARVDHIGSVGKVLARAEQGFAYEAEIAAAPPQPRREPAPAPRPEPQTAERSQPTPPTPEPQPAAPAAAEPKRAGDSAAAPAGQTPSVPDVAASGAKPEPPEPPATNAAAPDAGANSPTASASASAPPAAQQADAPSTPDAANPVVASIDTAQVARGDSLWRISRKTYGRGMRYTAIFTANDDQIRNPDLIYPGQVLVLPADKAEAPER